MPSLEWELEKLLKQYQDAARKAHVISPHPNQRTFYMGAEFGIQEALSAIRKLKSKKGA